MLVVADGQVALDEKHLLPVVVHEWLLRVQSGRQAQQARAAAAFALGIERAEL
ncbi:hypothetical protein JYG32_24640 [Burkholderia pyrrocinia]|nr:hypothetical protein [Burkholderia pyrrocinia]QVN22532.1 hypothetical protein JYG32_24640 [Burkholderia pyrrocinia]